MKYITLFILLVAFGYPTLQAQNEKKITILPYRPPKKTIRPKTSSKHKQAKPAPKKEMLDKARIEKADTVDDYLRKNSQLRMAPSSSSSAYTATVPGFVAGERSRYQKGETQSSIRNIPFTFRPEDKFSRDPRNLPVEPGVAGGGKSHAGMGISVDLNQALAMAFSKNARLRARNGKKRLWEKYPKVVPNDSLVNELNSHPKKMLSVKQQNDSLIQLPDSALKVTTSTLHTSGRQKNGNRNEGLLSP